MSRPEITRYMKVLEETGVAKRAVEGCTHDLSLEVDVLREMTHWRDRQRAISSHFIDAFD